MPIGPDCHQNNDSGQLQSNTWLERRGRQVKHGSKQQNLNKIDERQARTHNGGSSTTTHGKVQGWEIMMQEKLARHDEEGEVMKEPSQKEEAAQLIIVNHRG